MSADASLRVRFEQGTRSRGRDVRIREARRGRFQGGLQENRDV